MEEEESTVWSDMLSQTCPISPAGSHCPNSCNYGGLQHHVCVKWPQREKNFPEIIVTAVSSLSMNITEFTFGAFRKAGCVAQVAVCTHVVSVSCAQHHSP
jgi:hypothetical protein